VEWTSGGKHDYKPVLDLGGVVSVLAVDVSYIVNNNWGKFAPKSIMVTGGLTKDTMAQSATLTTGISLQTGGHTARVDTSSWSSVRYVKIVHVVPAQGHAVLSEIDVFGHVQRLSPFPPPPRPPPPPPPPPDTLKAGSCLKANDMLVSADGRFKAIMQTDGNFVLYQGTAPLWSANTHGQGANQVCLQTDDNLVVYAGTPSTIAKWANGIHRSSRACTLKMQNDGNLVQYCPGITPPWASHTCCR